MKGRFRYIWNYEVARLPQLYMKKCGFRLQAKGIRASHGLRIQAEAFRFSHAGGAGVPARPRRPLSDRIP